MEHEIKNINDKRVHFDEILESNENNKIIGKN